MENLKFGLCILDENDDILTQKTLKATFTNELIDKLDENYGIDITDDISEMLEQQLNEEITKDVIKDMIKSVEV